MTFINLKIYKSQLREVFKITCEEFVFRENFPAEQQFIALSKYIVDQTQSASLKVCMYMQKSFLY